MLDNLKSMLSSENSMISALEDAAEKIAGSDDDIEDAFLNNSNLISDGVENDPEIEKIVEMIPESEDSDLITDKDVSEMIESYIPESKLNVNEACECDMLPDDDADMIEDLGDEPENGERVETFESFIDDDFNDLGITMESDVDELEIDSDIDVEDIEEENSVDTDDDLLEAFADDDIDLGDDLFEASADDDVDLSDDDLIEDEIIEDEIS